MKVRPNLGSELAILKMLFRSGVKGQANNVNSYAPAPAPPFTFHCASNLFSCDTTSR